MRNMIRENGEWVPNPKKIMDFFRRHPKNNVVVATYRGKKLMGLIPGTNIVTTTGEVYYAQRACTESPTNNYTTMWLASNGPGTPAKTDNRGNFTDIASSNKANATNYPKSNDNDTDNTGAGANVISWLFSYAANDGNFANIGWCYVTKSGNTGNDSLLCSVKFGANWNKDSNTSAKVFVNHGENGV
jgi:hypothetical protein